jgi:hypothetical protein
MFICSAYHSPLTTHHQEYDGAISFATDAWTSPNHRPYICLTAHLEHEGSPISFILDFVELPKSHSGKNMAEEFARILSHFDIEDKVSIHRLA